MCTDWLASVSVGAPTVMTFTTTVGEGKGQQQAHQSSGGDDDHLLPKSKLKHLVYLPPKSALLLRGEARYRWRHAIGQTALDVVPLRVGRKVTGLSRLALSPRGTSSSSSSIRYSFTFRKVTPPGYQCQCPYPTFCDVSVLHLKYRKPTLFLPPPFCRAKTPPPPPPLPPKLQLPQTSLFRHLQMS